MTAYYNENDDKAAAWLRELIKRNLIAPGDVDERSIEDVRPDDLLGYTQCHFFAGIGGWSYALRLAGWPDDRPVWTGSCPCQPFSQAGKREGYEDERHLWPHFHRLIAERRPVVVFGEQVAAAIGLDWLDNVSVDLEAIGYACGAIVLPACSVGAPHIRQRLWFVADNASERRRGARPVIDRSTQRSTDGRATGELADTMSAGRPERRAEPRNGQIAGSGESGELADSECSESARQRQHCGQVLPEQETAGSGCGGIVGYAERYGLQGRSIQDVCGTGRWEEGPETGCTSGASFWSAADWLPCRDGKIRPVESGTFPLAYGVSEVLGRVCADGMGEIEEIKNVEDLYRVWEDLISTEGRLQEEVLQSGMSMETSDQKTCDKGSWQKSSAEHVRQQILRGLWEGRRESPTSRRWESDEQRSAEHQDTMSGVPYRAAPLGEILVGKKSRVGMLRGYGNAIVPEVAAEVIRAYMELSEERRKA